MHIPTWTYRAITGSVGELMLDGRPICMVLAAPDGYILDTGERIARLLNEDEQKKGK